MKMTDNNGPQSVEALLFQGNQLLSDKNLTAAIEQYKKAIQLAFTTNRELVSSATIKALLQNMVQAYLANGDTKAAAAWVKTAANYGLTISGTLVPNRGGITLADLKEPDRDYLAQPKRGGLAEQIFNAHLQVLKQATDGEGKSLASRVASEAVHSLDDSTKRGDIKLSDS